MSKAYLHHLLIAVEDLERARKFYTDVLEMQEIDRPSFPYPGIWYKIGDGQQQLHIIARTRRSVATSGSMLTTYISHCAWRVVIAIRSCGSAAKVSVTMSPTTTPKRWCYALSP